MAGKFNVLSVGEEFGADADQLASAAPGDCSMEEKRRRGVILTTLAALFVLLALSDISKPLSGGRAGLVFFGTKTTGLANAILAPAFGLFLLIYALGSWRRRRWAVPMAWIYAAYVPINLTLFTIQTPEKWQPPFFASVYVAIALGVSSGSAILLTRHIRQLS